MFRTLLKKEILGYLFSFRFVLVFVLFVGLMPVSLVIMARHYGQAQKLYAASRDLHWEALSKIREIQTRHDQIDALNDYGIYEAVSPQPLGLFVQGIEGVMPFQVSVSSFFTREFSRATYGNPVSALFQTPDFGYVVTLITSLVALLFTFDAVCGERERGTLRLMLAFSVPRYQVLLSKWLGAYLCLTLPFLIALLGIVTGVYALGILQMGGEIPIRLGLMVGTSLLYLALFCSLGMMVSVMMRYSGAALLVVLTVWAGWVLVIPNLALMASRVVWPVVSLSNLEAQQQMVGGRREERERNFQALRQTYRNQVRQQMQAGKLMSRLSPAASFQYATTELAGTGAERWLNYRNALGGFGRTYRAYTDTLWKALSYKDPLLDIQKGKPIEVWLKQEELPRLDLKAERTEDVLGRVGMDLGVLVGFGMVFLVGGYVAFLKYDVR